MTPDSLIYLYCIVEAGTAVQRLLEERGVPGLEPDEPLFSIEAAGLVAAVSRVPAATFQEEPLNALVSDLSRLAPFAVRHEEAMRALLPAAPALVPMAFGAIYRDPERVAHLLRERADEFRYLLGSLRDKQEWGLKVFRDPARLGETAQTSSEALRKLEQEAVAAGPGRAYLLGRQRERLRAVETERLAAQALDVILQRLSSVSAAMRQDEAPGSAFRLPRRSNGPADRNAERGTRTADPDQPGVAQQAVRAAFLVDSAAAEAFHAIAAELERDYGPQGMQLEVTGPWAPYSFVGERHGPA